jgi:hypothetical protein
LGFTVGLVERRIRKTLSVDLFGIIDMIALTPHGVMGVQSTGSDFSGHWRKLTEDKAVSSALWLRTPGTSLMLIGWRKTGPATQKVWAPRIKMVGMNDLRAGLARARREDLTEPPHAP